MSDIWKTTLKNIKNEVSPEFYRSLSKIHTVTKKDSGGNSEIICSIPDSEKERLLNSGVKNKIETRLKSLFGNDIVLRFHDEKKKNHQSPGHNIKHEQVQSAISRFIKGDVGNDPLLLIGSAGTGKTYLIQKALSEAKITDYRFINIHDWKTDFIEALHKKDLSQFKVKNREGSVFILEGLDSLMKASPSIQEEFFYFIDKLINEKKRIIITSRVHPHNGEIIRTILSRILSGIVVELPAPDLDTASNFLQDQIKQMGWRIGKTGIKKVIGRSHCDFYMLESIITALYFYRSANPETPSSKTILNLIRESVDKRMKKDVSIDAIINATMNKFKISRPDLFSSSRKSGLVYPRQIAMYLVLKHSGMNKTSIARYFKKSDHSTVIHADKKISKLIESDESVRNCIQALEEELFKIVDNSVNNCE